MKKFSILNIAVILIYVVIASCSSQAKFASGSKKSYDLSLVKYSILHLHLLSTET